MVSVNLAFTSYESRMSFGEGLLLAVTTSIRAITFLKSYE